MLISKKLSHSMTSIMVENGTIKETEFELYQFCFDYLFEQVLYGMVVLSLGAVLHCFDTTALFYVIFSFFRRYSGGVHAKTERLCAVISDSIFAFVLLILPKCTFHNIRLWLGIYIVSALCISFLAPVEPANKHFTDKQKNNLRRICIIGLVPVTLLFFLMFNTQLYLYCGTISVCMALVAVSLLLGIHERKEYTYTC